MIRPLRSAPGGDRRRERTRNAIMEAGQQLFASRAPEGVTVDEIVAAADVAKGSFYNHFDDKDALASAIVDLVHGDCEFHIFAANRTVTDPPARIVRAMCVMIAYAADHPERLRAMISLSQRRLIADSPLNAGAIADLEDGIADGRFAGLTLEAGLILVVGLISTTMVHAITDPRASPPHMLGTIIGSRLLRALGLAADEATELACAAADELLKGAMA